MSNVNEQKRISKNLKMLRILHNLSLSQVSRDTGIPKGTLSSYEREGKISQDRLEVLANYYEVPWEFMVMTWVKVQGEVPKSYIF